VTGDIEGFEYLTTNISYNTNGNDLQATALMSYITGDSDWGAWPNSFNGFIVLGVAVEAALSGLDVEAEMLDQTDPGLFFCETVHQDGNTPLVLSAPSFDEGNNTLSVGYSDADSNLPWFKAAQICNTPANGGNCFAQVDMIPDSHDYGSGVEFSAEITQDIIDEFLEWNVNDNSGDCVIDDDMFDGEWLDPAMGQEMASIVGVVRYAYSKFRICPRTMNDIELCATCPVADAGDDQCTAPNTQITLDGSGSYDPNGSIIAHEWQQTGGSTVNLSCNEGPVNVVITHSLQERFTVDPPVCCHSCAIMEPFGS
jgi:hypothetical protein